MGEHWTHRRIARLSLLLVSVLSAFILTAISQPKFDRWYETDNAGLLFSTEARIAALLDQAKKSRRVGSDASFLRTVKRIVESSPRDTRVLNSATKVLTEYGDKTQCELALGLTTDYLVGNSPEAGVLSDRASAKSCLRDHRGAFEDLTQALEIAPTDFELMQKRLITLYSVEPVQTALDLYRITIKDCERNIARNPITVFRYKNILSNAYRGRSEAHKKLGDKAARLADLTLAIESFPFTPSPYCGDRSLAFREYKMYNEAIADMNSHFEYLANSRRLSYVDYVHRALLFEEAGRYADAIADYVTAAKASPQNKAAYQLRVDELTRKIP